MRLIKRNRTKQPGAIHLIVIVIVVILIIVALFSGPADDSKEKTDGVFKADIELIDSQNKSLVLEEIPSSIQFRVNTKENVKPTVQIMVNDEFISTSPRLVPSEGNYTFSLHLSKLQQGSNTLKIIAFGKQEEQYEKKSVEEEFKLITAVTEAPVIEITEASRDDSGQWIIDSLTRSDKKISISTRLGKSTSWANELTINNQPLDSSGDYGFYSHAITNIPDGESSYTITASNAAGSTSETLTINKISEIEKRQTYERQQAAMEARAACAQYAELQLGIKDIHVNTRHSSSITKHNPDGTYLLKAEIADSNGFFGKDIPIGIMECVTDPTGMHVQSFFSMRY